MLAHVFLTPQYSLYMYKLNQYASGECLATSQPI